MASRLYIGEGQVLWVYSQIGSMYQIGLRGGSVKRFGCTRHSEPAEQTRINKGEGRVSGCTGSLDLFIK